MSINKVVLTGNLTRDVEKTETTSGIAVCRFSIAINSGYREDKKTDFFNIVVWRNQAENCGKYLKKGSKVAVIGSLQNRSYEDKEGNKRTVTEIVASEVEFLSSASEDKKESKQMVLEEVADDGKLPF